MSKWFPLKTECHTFYVCACDRLYINISQRIPFNTMKSWLSIFFSSLNLNGFVKHTFFLLKPNSIHINFSFVKLLLRKEMLIFAEQKCRQNASDVHKIDVDISLLSHRSRMLLFHLTHCYLHIHDILYLLVSGAFTHIYNQHCIDMVCIRCVLHTILFRSFHLFYLVNKHRFTK